MEKEMGGPIGGGPMKGDGGSLTREMTRESDGAGQWARGRAFGRGCLGAIGGCWLGWGPQEGHGRGGRPVRGSHWGRGLIGRVGSGYFQNSNHSGTKFCQKLPCNHTIIFS